MQLAPEFGKFSDVFKTITAKLAILVVFLIGFPTLVYPAMPASYQAHIAPWFLEGCYWLGLLVAAGIIPGRAKAQSNTNMDGSFKSFAMFAILIGASVLMTACTPKALPKPDTIKQAGVEALVAYGLAGSVAHTYLAYPLCTQPITVAPCKTENLANKVKKADDAAYKAAVAADDAANNDPSKNKTAQSKLNVLKDVNVEASAGAKP